MSPGVRVQQNQDAEDRTGGCVRGEVEPGVIKHTTKCPRNMAIDIIQGNMMSYSRDKAVSLEKQNVDLLTRMV